MIEQEPQDRSDQRNDFEKLSQELIEPTKNDEEVKKEEEIIPKQG